VSTLELLATAALLVFIAWCGLDITWKIKLIRGIQEDKQ
jgi:hypothetical protein